MCVIANGKCERGCAFEMCSRITNKRALKLIKYHHSRAGGTVLLTSFHMIDNVKKVTFERGWKLRFKTTIQDFIF